jgi:hypothetical protein
VFRIPDLHEGERLVGNDPDRGAHDKLLIQRLSDVWDIDLCPKTTIWGERFSRA